MFPSLTIFRAVLGLFSGIMALVALVTLWIPETKDVSIAQIERGVLYGEAVGSDSDGTTPSEADIPVVQGDKQGLEDSKTIVEVV